MAISVARTIILYITVIFTLRLMGKRQIGELEPAELAVTILISELAAIPMQDVSTPLVQGLIPIALLLALEFIVTSLIMRFEPLSRLMSGRSNVLLSDGKILEAELRKSRITISEFLEGLRLLGVTDLNSLKYAILETNGKLSIIKKNQFESPTRADMNLPISELGLPVIIINDGKVLHEVLSARGKEVNWLNAQLKQHDISSPEQVFVMLLDQLDQVYVIRKEKI